MFDKKNMSACWKLCSFTLHYMSWDFVGLTISVQCGMKAILLDLGQPRLRSLAKPSDTIKLLVLLAELQATKFSCKVKSASPWSLSAEASSKSLEFSVGCACATTPQVMTWNLTSYWNLCPATLLLLYQIARLGTCNQRKLILVLGPNYVQVYLQLKRTLSNSPVPFSLAHLRCFWQSLVQERFNTKNAIVYAVYWKGVDVCWLLNLWLKWLLQF